MGNIVDMKQLRAWVSKRRDLAAELQAAKKKKSGPADSGDTNSTQWESISRDPSNLTAARPDSPPPETHVSSSGVGTPAATTKGSTPVDIPPEVIHLDGYLEGGVGSQSVTLSYHISPSPKLLLRWPLTRGPIVGLSFKRIETDCLTGSPEHHLSWGPVKLTRQPPRKGLGWRLPLWCRVDV